MVVSNTGGLNTFRDVVSYYIGSLGCIGCWKCYLPVKNYPPVNFIIALATASTQWPPWEPTATEQLQTMMPQRLRPHEKLPPKKNCDTLKLMLPAAATATCVPYAWSPRETTTLWKVTVVTVCALLMHDLFAIAKFLVFSMLYRVQLNGLLEWKSMPNQQHPWTKGTSTKAEIQNIKALTHFYTQNTKCTDTF